ncbi:DUF3857 domain-containing protein [Maribacter sp. 2308TA10-17]|uniref:DUF3857 domain-containing protein n=1 Tax=Maribacter sp. 2308TA10-17 TaxID=3386276 RepID=UPI0039BD4B29
MAIKYAYIILAILFFQYTLEAQIPKEDFGKLTYQERTMTAYDKDTTANAVVLYERGDNYFTVVKRKIRLVIEYHGKIKILNKKAYDLGTVKIPLYHTENASEKLIEIKAVTYNGISEFHVQPSEIFTEDISENWKEKSFTFPNLQPGSIIEYSYKVHTPFYYNFNGWKFQTNIPVIYSEFNAKIPGNWKYNRTLMGYEKLDVNTANIEENCFYVLGFGKTASCEVLKYIMKDIPAFKDEENYMLAPSNYRAAIEFELAEFNDFNGIPHKYTETWKTADKKFRGDKDIGRQLTKKGFFENQVPGDLLTQGDPLARAKNIYDYVRKHFSWNKKYGVYKKARVKDAFDRGSGSVSEINMSLINLLKAADIKTNLMLLSTRNSGLPKRTHPVMSDFNYIIAKAEIDGKSYLLDATDKYIPFGVLPFRALNHYGRVMDYKNESSWFDIIPNKNNKVIIRAKLKLDIENEKNSGILDITHLGYKAIGQRKKLADLSEDDYLDAMENGIEGDILFTSHDRTDDTTDEKKVVERFEFEIDQKLQSDMVYINPFLIRFFKQNPFLLEKRNYPVDFGYPSTYKYQINIEIPNGYAVHELPEKQIVQMAGKQAFLKFDLVENATNLALIFDLKINHYHIQSKDYPALKELFEHVTDIQNNTLIVLKKE